MSLFPDLYLIYLQILIQIFPPNFNPNQCLIYKIQSELKSYRFNLQIYKFNKF